MKLTYSILYRELQCTKLLTKSKRFDQFNWNLMWIWLALSWLMLVFLYLWFKAACCSTHICFVLFCFFFSLISLYKSHALCMFPITTVVILVATSIWHQLIGKFVRVTTSGTNTQPFLKKMAPVAFFSYLVHKTFPYA